MKKIILAGAAALLAIGAAFAQVVAPQVASLNLNDLVQVVPRGLGQATSYFTPPGAIAGVEQYSYQVPLTAFAITPPNLTSLLYINPAGTLATGALTMEAVASDGQKFCFESSQTQTAVTVAANTGQTLASFGLGALTAMVANTRYCWLYNANLAVWIRTS